MPPEHFLISFPRSFRYYFWTWSRLSVGPHLHLFLRLSSFQDCVLCFNSHVTISRHQNLKFSITFNFYSDFSRNVTQHPTLELDNKFLKFHNTKIAQKVPFFITNHPTFSSRLCSLPSETHHEVQSEVAWGACFTVRTVNLGQVRKIKMWSAHRFFGVVKIVFQFKLKDNFYKYISDMCKLFWQSFFEFSQKLLRIENRNFVRFPPMCLSEMLLNCVNIFSDSTYVTKPLKVWFSFQAFWRAFHSETCP